ncbi:hypothetical protein B0H14DRAFT_136170 [Mycena olivaceomarginata]|nr:hypothetical protein B0H14DRAFT_136170 [Mycena olivaceomarginata]
MARERTPAQHPRSISALRSAARRLISRCSALASLLCTGRRCSMPVRVVVLDSRTFETRSFMHHERPKIAALTRADFFELMNPSTSECNGAVKLAIDLPPSSRLRARSSLIRETVPCRAALLFAAVAPRYPGDIYHRSCSPVTDCVRWFRSLRRRLCDDAGPRVLCGPCSKGSKRKKSPRARGAEAHSWVGLAPPVRRVSCGECAERVDGVGLWNRWRR